MRATPRAEAEATVIWHIFHEIGLVKHAHQDWEVEEARNFVTLDQEHSLESVPASDVLDVIALWLRFHEGVTDLIESKQMARAYLEMSYQAFGEAGRWPVA